MKSLAPIALFVYNRPEHTRRCLEALTANPLAKNSVLHIFSDGPKQGASPEEINHIEAVQKVIAEKPWCGTVHIHNSPANKGLFRSIVDGIDWILADHESIIIIEDDIITSPRFLEFCNDSLVKYRDEEKVWLVSGYMFPLNARHKSPPTYFLPTLSCWGWCTWKRAWKKFNPDAASMLQTIKENNSRFDFDLHGSYPYFEMLEQRAVGKNQSWDICWYASFFLGHGLCLYPAITLADNIGMDGSGTHWTGTGWKSRKFDTSTNNPFVFPQKIEADQSVQRLLESMLRHEYQPGLMRRILRKLKLLK